MHIHVYDHAKVMPDGRLVPYGAKGQKKKAMLLYSRI